MIYLLYGEETYLLENKLKKIKKEFGEIIKGINFIQIDESNVAEIISNIETPSFGYDKKLIIAKNTGLFKKEKKKTKGKTSESKKDVNSIENKLADYILENTNVFKESIELVFIEETVEKNVLYEVIEKNGEIVECDLLTMPQLIQNIVKICNAYKVKIDNQTAKYFVECSRN